MDHNITQHATISYSFWILGPCLPLVYSKYGDQIMKLMDHQKKEGMEPFIICSFWIQALPCITI